jgi:hypothetical protein
VLDIAVLGFPEEEGADEESHDGDDDGIGDDRLVGDAADRLERQALLGEEILGLVAFGEVVPRADEDMEIAVDGGDGDADFLLIRLQRRIDVMGQRFERREVGDGGDQATEHAIFRRPILSDSQPKKTKNGVASSKEAPMRI